jgi:hypothetical protein
MRARVASAPRTTCAPVDDIPADYGRGLKGAGWP